MDFFRILISHNVIFRWRSVLGVDEFFFDPLTTANDLPDLGLRPFTLAAWNRECPMQQRSMALLQNLCLNQLVCPFGCASDMMGNGLYKHERKAYSRPDILEFPPGACDTSGSPQSTNEWKVTETGALHLTLAHVCHCNFIDTTYFSDRLKPSERAPLGLYVSFKIIKIEAIAAKLYAGEVKLVIKL